MTTKDLVLAELSAADAYISGEALSRTLGVSRAAINAAVQKLREEGCVIDSATNRGYLLKESPDLLTYGSLLPYLGRERMRRVTCYDVTDSTNRRLMEASQDPVVQDGSVAIADRQTAGRGRRGRSFSSPGGKGIYLSMLIRPADRDPAAAWTTVTARTAVAVCDAIESVCAVRPGIKWVNDLLLEGKKICGILTQMELDTETGDVRGIVVGIGINVLETLRDFPKELRQTAASLYQITGQKFSRAQLAAEIIRRLDDLFAAWPAGHAEALAQYRADSLVLRKKILVLTQTADGISEKKATAEKIGDDFALHVRYADGSRAVLRGGEISIRKV